MPGRSTSSCARTARPGDQATLQMNGPPSAVALRRAPATADVARIGMSSHTRAMLEGRIVPMLLRMAWPNILVMVAQSASGLIETWFVSRLGTDALAGMALVFPIVLLRRSG